MQLLLALGLLTGLVAAPSEPELVVSVGHAGAPQLAAFVNDFLATASRTEVALIDLESGFTIGRLSQGSLVLALEASPAGDLLAVGTCDHSIQLWNIRSRTLVRRLALTQECADSLSFSPDGVFLAANANGCDGRMGLQVWDVRTGDLARGIAEGSATEHVAFSGDGRWLAGVDNRGNTSVFEWPSGNQLRVFEGPEHPVPRVSAIVASRDGRYLARLGSDGLRVFDVESGSQIPLPGARTVNMRDVPRDGPEREWSQRLVSAEAPAFLIDGRLAYIDFDQLVVMTLPDGPYERLPLIAPWTEGSGGVGPADPPSWLKIRRDGRLLAGSGGSETVLWDVASARLRDLSAHALTSPTSLRWSRSGLIAWADGEPGVRGWNDRKGRPADLAFDIDYATAIAFRPDGTRIAVSDLSSMQVFEVARRRPVASTQLPPSARAGVAFSPDGSRLAFAMSDGLAVFDEELRPQVRFATLGAHTSAEHIAFSPDGRWVAAGLAGPGPELSVWPMAARSAAVTLDSDKLTHGPQPPAFSSDSRWLASFSQGETVVIWATSSWAVERTWTLPGTGRELAFAPEGTRLAIAADGEAAIWDAATGGKLVTLSSPGSNEAREIAWSPDGHRIVSSTDDGVLRFWNASDGRPLVSLYMLAASGDWLLVAPDGRLEGSARALTDLVAWRIGDRVMADAALTERHRVRNLWRSLSPSAPGE